MRYEVPMGVLSHVRTASLVLFALALLVLSLLAEVSTASAPTSASPSPLAASGLSSPGILLMPQTRTPIQHVIIAIYENHAFDNYFSNYTGLLGNPAFGDPPGGVPQPWTKTNITGYTIPYNLNWTYDASGAVGNNETSSVPDHDETSIRGNEDNGSMDGYSYTDTNVSVGMFPTNITPNMHGLAQQYAIGDSYFHAFAGPTLPNRFYYYADTSGPVHSNSDPANGSNEVYFNSMPWELTQNGISWNDFDGSYDSLNSTCILDVFCSDPSFYFTTTLSQLMPMLYFNWIQKYQGQLGHEQEYSQLFTDLQDGGLPAVSWYTPDWLCCTEHPGTIDGFGGNITQGEQSLLQLVFAVEHSPYWDSTAMFISFDEAGGFYDSVPPPTLTPNGPGVRMPLLVISPYAKEGYISHELLTPSSLLHFIEWNWGLPSLEGGGPGLDTESNLPLDFFNFSASPRAPLPWSITGANNLTSYPWPYTQPVPSSLTGLYQPSFVTHGNVSWAVQTNNVVINRPAQTADGTILYEAGMDGILRAVNPMTGAQIWTRSLGTASRSDPALLPDDGVITTTLRGVVTAFSSTGSVLWNLSLGAPIYGGLTVVQGSYYGALNNGTLFEVSENGTVEWENHLTWGPIYSPLTYDPSSNLLFASASTQGVVAVTLSGALAWTAGIPGGVYAAGAVSSGTLYICGTDGGLYPITTASGLVGSPGPLASPCVDAPLISGTTLYIGNETGALEAFSLPGLSHLWTDQLWGDVAGTPGMEGSDLWVGSGGGDLYEINPSTGGILLDMHSNSSFYAGVLTTPTGIYFGAEDGNLYGINEGGWLHVGITPPVANVSIAGTQVTTSNGKALFLLGAGSVTVTGSAPGFSTSSATVTVPKGGSAWVNLSLISNAVRPGVLAISVTPGSATITVNGTALSAQTNGTYRVVESPWPYVVGASASGYLSQTATVKVRAQAVVYQNFTLQPSVGVSPGTLEVQLSPTFATLTVNGTTQSGQPTGTYTLSENPWPFQLSAGATGYITQTALVQVHSGKTTYQNFTLQKVGTAHPGWAAGEVENSSNGQSIAGATLTFYPGAISVVSGSGGLFNESLLPGTYSVFVNDSTGGYEPYHSSQTVYASATSTFDIDLVANPRPGEISGWVYNGSESDPLAGVWVQIFPTGASAVTSSLGAFDFWPSPGTYTLFVNDSAADYQNFSQTDVVVTSEATTIVNLVLNYSGCVKNCGKTPTVVAGSSGSINWVLWGLILAIVVAAGILLAAVILRNRKRKGEAIPPEAVVMAAPAAAPDYVEGAPDPSVAYAEGPPPGGEAPPSSDEVAPHPLAGSSWQPPPQGPG